MKVGDLVTFCDAETSVDIVEPIGFKLRDPQCRLFEKNRVRVGYDDTGIIVLEVDDNDEKEKLYKVMMKGCSLWFFEHNLKKL